jgi:hypothetical protein
MRQSNQTVAGNPRHRFLGTGRRQIVKRQRHFLAVKIDLEHAVDRLSDDGELLYSAVTTGIRIIRPACSGCAA